MSSLDIPARYQIGDRVRIDNAVQTTAVLPGYVGTIKEVIPNYADKTIGYNLLLENDPRPGRVWFFLQEQLKPASSGVGREKRS
jgi:hypothetical protein